MRNNKYFSDFYKSKYKNYFKGDVLRNNISLEEEDGHIKWGVNDDLPYQIRSIVDSSATGKSCIDTKSKYIYGNGFSDEFGKLSVNNEGDTVNDLTRQVASQLAYYNSFAIKVLRNIEGEIKELFFMPVEGIRLEASNKKKVKRIAYNPLFGTEDKHQIKTEYYYPFNPDKHEYAIKVQEWISKDLKNNTVFNFPGEIYLETNYRPFSPYYSVPAYWGTIKGGGNYWMQVDAAISEFHGNNIANDFRPSYIIDIIGNQDEVVDVQRNSKGEIINEIKAGEKMEQELKNTLGSQNAGKAIIRWLNNPEDVTKITEFKGSDNDKVYLALKSIVQQSILTATQIPPVLAMIETAGKLGNSQEIRNASMLLNNLVQQDRKTIEKLFSNLMPGKYKSNKIRNFVPLLEIPDNVLNLMSEEERINYINSYYGLDIKHKNKNVL